jgi:hypothetical protein
VLPAAVRELPTEELHNLAQRQMGAGKFALARSIYEEILLRDEDQAPCLSMLGSIGYLTGQDELADGFVQRALDLYRERLAESPSDSNARAHYAGLLLAQGDIEEGERALEGTDFPLQGRGLSQGDFFELFQAGIDRGLPLTLFVGAPYSGCEMLAQCLASGLRIPFGLMSMGMFPRTTLIPSRLFVAAQGGFAAAESIAPSLYNLEKLQTAGISRLVLVTRDPRAAVLSWCQSIMNDSAMRIMAPLWRETYPPHAVLRQGPEAVLSWGIETLLPIVCGCLADWRAVAEEPGSSWRLHVTSIEKTTEDPIGEANRILAHFEIGAGEFDTGAADLPQPSKLTGPPQWRKGYTAAQLAQADDVLADDLAQAFGWRK